MLKTRPSTIAAGLTGLGLAFSAAAPMMGVDARGQGPVYGAPAGMAPAALAPASVLLMSDGRVIQGTILETDDGYVVTTGFGPLNFKRREVIGAFAGIPEIYAYKRSIVPENDPDERLKLAQWCIAQKMYREAQAELELVLAVSPGLRRAEQMMHMLATKVNAPTDDAVRLSSGIAEPGMEVPGRTGPSPDESEPPATLSPNILRELRDEYRRNPKADIPVIFELPPQQAVKRYREFASFIHPALQRSCAGCHNEESDSSFRLIQTRVRRDMENDLVIRANLDAVLPLIDPSQPESSKLLTSSIMPHPPNNRPVLTGPNSRTYQQFAAWVAGVSEYGGTAPGTPAVATATGAELGVIRRDAAALPAVHATGAAVGSAGGFAVDRTTGTAAGPVSVPVQQPAAAPNENPNPGIKLAPAPKPTQVVHPPPGPMVEFERTAPGQVFPETASGKLRFPQSEPLPGPAAAIVDEKPRGLVPGVEPGEAEEPVGAEEAPAPAPPKKPIKVRGDVLEKFMTGRRG